MLFMAFTLLEAGLTAHYADAKSFGGGRSFKMTPRTPSKSVQPMAPKNGGSFGRGLAGGLLGGALGGLLFGSMFGAAGSGMGILPLLVLGGLAYFLYKRFSTKPRQQGYQSYQQNPGQQSPSNMFSGAFGNSAQPPPSTPDIGGNLLAEGIDQIRGTRQGF